ncbi:MAG: glycosyltransferase [Candidatus Xenobiia bacterium LiM19]
MRIFDRIIKKVCGPLLSPHGLGYIDSIDGHELKDLHGTLDLKTRLSVTVSGWVIDSESGNLADEVYICIGGNQFKALYGLRRPDVAHHYQNPAIENSGFSCNIPVQMFKGGKNEITLKIVSQKRKKTTIQKASITIKTDSPYGLSSSQRKYFKKKQKRYNADVVLSIIIPCFNDGKYILEAIESVEKTISINYELIIVNDGSTDEATSRIINELEIKGYRVIHLHNLGPSAARNIGIQNSKGKYILPLDADNIIKPDFINLSVNILETNSFTDIVYTDREEFGLRNRVVSVDDFNLQKMLHENYIDTCAIYRRDVWRKCGGYDEKMKAGLEDWDFWITAYYHGFRYFHIPLPLYLYRVKENSWTMLHINEANEKKVIDTTLYIYSKHPELFSKAYGECGERLHFFDKYNILMNPQKKIPYDEYIKNRNNDDSARAAIARESELFWFTPGISIIIPVFEVEPAILRLTIESVTSQFYFNWELCIGNASPDKDVKALLDDYARVNPRIRIIHLKENGGISENSNAALTLATGEFVATLDHDDLLAKDALFQIVKLLQEFPETDILYTDEDKIDADGTFCQPNFKPDWSPDLFLSMNYINHLWVCRKSIIDCLGGFRKEFDGAQDYDLLLRATELTENIKHIPIVLYTWRMSPGSISVDPEAKPYSQTSGINALTKAMERRKINATVKSNVKHNYIIRYRLTDNPLVSIIIQALEAKLLDNCIKSILSKTDYEHYEIVIVDNNSSEKEALDYLEHLKSNFPQKIRVLKNNCCFSYAAGNNFAAQTVRGSCLLFLSNGTEVINSDWMTVLLEQAQRQEVGAVGCRLLFPDSTVQHAGIIMGIGPRRLPFNVFHGQVPDNTHFHLANLIRNYCAVTGACLMIRKDVFDLVDGFDEKYKSIYSDIDLCLKLYKLKFLITYTPLSRLFYTEHAQHGCAETTEDENRLINRWREFVSGDPYYNPNFDHDPEKAFRWRGF